MAKRKPEKEIKVRLVLTEGYRQRYTQACLDVLRERERRARLEKGILEDGSVVPLRRDGEKEAI